MEDELMLLQNLATSFEFFSGPYVLKHSGAHALALSTTPLSNRETIYLPAGSYKQSNWVTRNQSQYLYVLQCPLYGYCLNTSSNNE